MPIALEVVLAIIFGSMSLYACVKVAWKTNVSKNLALKHRILNWIIIFLLLVAAVCAIILLAKVLLFLI